MQIAQEEAHGRSLVAAMLAEMAWERSGLARKGSAAEKIGHCAGDGCLGYRRLFGRQQKSINNGGGLLREAVQTPWLFRGAPCSAGHCGPGALGQFAKFMEKGGCAQGARSVLVYKKSLKRHAMGTPFGADVRKNTRQFSRSKGRLNENAN